MPSSHSSPEAQPLTPNYKVVAPDSSNHGSNFALSRPHGAGQLPGQKSPGSKAANLESQTGYSKQAGLSEALSPHRVCYFGT